MTAARIRQLPSRVTDAIAAGEVIERPASVVKELIENSIDAGSTRVQVSIAGGGLTLIEVADDGAGIAADDLELALAPHATSKIRSEHDLEEVASLGFRGEALASIAAVADVRLVSRPATQLSAATIRARGGRILERGAASGPPGTRVTVTDLFAATPARLRFLRGERAEAAAVRRIVADLALGRPDLAVRFTAGGATVLETPGRATLREVAGVVLGRQAAAALVDVEAGGDVEVSGLLSSPAVHQGTRAGIVIFVNGRRVQSPLLTTAIVDAYRGLLPAGRYPFGVVEVRVAPLGVDVNVHPAKREVRFRDDRSVFAAVQRASWMAVRAQVDVPAATATAWARDWAVPANTATLHLNDEASPGDHEVAALGAVAPLTVLGQAYGEWIVAAGQDAVVVIDPHAAHEKLLYEELLAAWRSGAPEVQLLLIPAVVELTPAAWEQYEASAGVLGRCGFQLEPFGPSTLRCTAVPAAVSRADPGRLVEELLEAAATGDGEQRLHRAASLAACHAAVRFGDRLDPAEQQRIADRLPVTPGGSTCPHGRPTAIVLREAGLRRSFRRP